MLFDLLIKNSRLASSGHAPQTTALIILHEIGPKLNICCKKLTGSQLLLLIFLVEFYSSQFFQELKKKPQTSSFETGTESSEDRWYERAFHHFHFYMCRNKQTETDNTKIVLKECLTNDSGHIRHKNSLREYFFF